MFLESLRENQKYGWLNSLGRIWIANFGAQDPDRNLSNLPLKDICPGRGKQTHAYLDISEYVGKYSRVWRGHISSAYSVWLNVALRIRRGAHIRRDVLYLQNGTLLYEPCTKNIKNMLNL